MQQLARHGVKEFHFYTLNRAELTYAICHALRSAWHERAAWMRPRGNGASSNSKELLEQRIVLLDGAMGTMIQQHRLDEAGYRGERFRSYERDVRGNNDLLTLTRPELIVDIHRAYLEAGADIIETNTFNSTAISQADYGMEALVSEINLAAAQLARGVADEFAQGAGPAGLCRRRARPDEPHGIACRRM